MYEEIFNLKLDALANVRIKAISSVEIGVGAPTKMASGKYGTVKISFGVGGTATMTGLGIEFSDGDYGYQIIFNNQYGYIFSSDMAQWQRVTSSNGSYQVTQNIINELIDNNKWILENNLLCARGLELAQSVGVAMPVGFRQNLYNLQARLVARNLKIKESESVQDVQEAASPNFSVYNQSLVTFMETPQIGIIPVIYIIVVAVILIASTAVTTWAIFKSLHAESKADFSLSSDLTAQLVKYLPADTYKQLMAENAANQKKAQEAIDAASGKSLMNTIKYIGAGLIGFWAIDKFLLSRKNNAQ
jgi:hypothetical protein